MATLETLFTSMLYDLDDMTGTKYSQFMLLDRYNKGNKMLRQIIFNAMPMQLAEEITGTINVGESLTMPKKPVKFIDFRIGKDPINKISISEIPDKTTTGKPCYYYLLNTSTVKFYPVPDKAYSYEIIYVAEAADKAATDDSGYQAEIEQVLVRYVVATLKGQPFDMAVEFAAVSNMLAGIESGVTVINGYDQVGYFNRDYR
jgi:hypothetical protein